MFWDYESYPHWFRDQNYISNLAFTEVENLLKLRTLLVKTVDKIADPDNNDKSIIRELFEIK